MREQTCSASDEAASAAMAALEAPPDKTATVLSIERNGQRLGFSAAPKISAAFGPDDEPQLPGLNAVRGMANNYNVTRMDATRLKIT
jgi:hypothetical protein